MKLTPEEESELNALYSLQESLVPMSQNQFDRLKYLKEKTFQNACVNYGCTGYHGTDEEAVCKKCGNKLYKSPLLI